MEFNWIKKGLIFNPKDRFDWMHGYSQVPTVLEKDDFLRIYFTCRPKHDEFGNSVSLMSYIDVDKNDPSKILYIHDKSILPLGGLGDFDEFGVHPGTIIENDKLIYFYYQGWTRLVSVPYATALGLAISSDGGETFKKYAKGPLFSRTYNEPYLENGFFIFKEDKYYMWYASCFEWVVVGGKKEPIYQIVSATSNDGINWVRNGIPCFPTKFEQEASGRPCVIKIGNLYHMWFCYRNVADFRNGGDGAYKIGYAYSADMNNWTRDDSKAGINLSSEGWDSEMIAYPFVIKINNKLLMFYNGNYFGKDGFGYAEITL